MIFKMSLRHVLLGLFLLFNASGFVARAAALPPEVLAVLARAHIEPRSLAVWVAPVGSVGSEAPRLAHNADQAFNPASLMKLVTSAVALDVLGPTYVWPTPIYLDGELRDGVLHGNLVVQGLGDPSLVVERVQRLLRAVQQRGVKEIRGDIVLDRQAFQIPAVDPGAFDAEPSRPYNVRPDALMLNYKSLTLNFVPEAALKKIRLWSEPALAGVTLPPQVALSEGQAPCGDWRSLLQPDWRDRSRPVFKGTMAWACGEKSWPVAYADPASYNARLLEAAWRELGGKLSGKVRDGAMPAHRTPWWTWDSPPLAEVLRDMNKHSNNVIAHQIFLSLSLAQQGVGTWEASQALVSERLRSQAGCAPESLRIDVGSGLSRDERLSAHCLAQVLQWTWTRPWMPELLASLPLAGETTIRRLTSLAGRAHLKTGSLDNVAGLAGYVEGTQPGQRWVVVVMLNDPNARSETARAVLEALLVGVLRWPPDDSMAPAASAP